MTEINHQQIFEIIESWAPKSLAYDWDNIGLQIGSSHHKTAKIMVTLDVTEAVVDEAITAGVNLIIAHHPLLFAPVKSIDVDSVKGRVIQKLIAHSITVYAAHTNLDIAPGGMNDIICQGLGIRDVENLIQTDKEVLIKLVVYVPEESSEQLRQALGDAGAGYIGNYSHCTFQSEGIGAFVPMEGTTPFIGDVNKLEHVAEIRIETIMKEKDISTILAVMKENHPYEEVAYDLYPLINSGQQFGIGRVGNLPEVILLSDLCDKTKAVFNMQQVRLVGNLEKEVKRVAVLAGSGEKYYHAALKHNADVYITGDMTYHHAQDALEMGLAVIDAGHYIEAIIKSALADSLTKRLTNHNITVIESLTNTDPFQFV